MEKKKPLKDKKEERREGIKKTVTPFLFGIFAGFLSFFLSSNPLEDTGLLILLLIILIQKFVYPLQHTSIKGAKDWIYISFITFFCWFVSFSLLLNINI